MANKKQCQWRNLKMPKQCLKEKSKKQSLKKTLTAREQLKLINDCSGKYDNTKDRKKKTQLEKSMSNMVDSVMETTNKDVVFNVRTGKLNSAPRKRRWIKRWI